MESRKIIVFNELNEKVRKRKDLLMNAKYIIILLYK